MENSENRTVNLRPPAQGTTPGLGVTRLASSTTAAKQDISGLPRLYGKRLRIKNESVAAGEAIFISFSLTGATDVSAAATAGATFAAGTTADQGFKLNPGESIDVRLDKAKHVFFHWDALAGTPVLCIFPVSPGVNGN